MNDTLDIEELNTLLRSAENKSRALAVHLEQLIRSGKLPNGSKLPPENYLTDQVSLSRGTIRAAFHHLVEEGLCVRRRGDGTYVHLPTSNVPVVNGAQMKVYVVISINRMTMLNHPFVTDTCRGIRAVLGNEYRIMLKVVDESQQAELFTEMSDAAAVVMISNQYQPVLQWLASERVNVISVTFRYRQHSFSSAMVDNREAGYLVARHMIELGCQRMLLLVAEFLSTEFSDRAVGVREAVEELGDGRTTLEVVELKSNTEGQAYATTLEYYEKMQPDGIIASKDLQAMEVICALQSIPNRAFKTRVAGVDDIYMASMTYPTLTTVNQQAEQLGKKVGSLILSKKIQKESHVVVQPALVVRDSTLVGV